VNGSDMLDLEGVWKRHRRWRRRPRSLKEALIAGFRGLRAEYDEFWALREVTFSARPGETLGFCGANGAGKSTLLRLIAGILEPTHGRITVRGRVATLLELGAGFLPDLTGRENIALNGALLGLSDAEIRCKLDAIIDFADLGDFIDSPVRTYSSGMYMRLGFAIASHVDADILLIDEVLAVGDAAFQLKCADWLTHLRQRETTVLIVSHDLPTLAARCDRVAWLDRGSVVAFGEPRTVVDRYASSQATGARLPAEAAP